ncbi:MAG: Uma2 family endonuclease [Promethearchaeota archaeon]
MFKFILTLLDLYVQEKKLGLVIGSRFSMKLSSKWAPEPDIIFIDSNCKHRLKENYLDAPATAVFEILSQFTRDDDLNKKLPKYLEVGIKEVWIIDPMDKRVIIYWSKENFKIYKGKERAESKIIPGFRLKVDWMWHIDSISVLEKYNELFT